MPRTASLAVLLALPALASCALEPVLGPAAAVSGVSLAITGKTPLDHVASLASGQDCSAVRYERRGPWCLPHPGPPPPQPYCTRSLGAVDCWTSPPPGAPLLGVADPAP
jgi:hypothetical protein